jgi:hypothetical protein
LNASSRGPEAKNAQQHSAATPSWWCLSLDLSWSRYGCLDVVALLQRQQGNIASPREWGLNMKRRFQ